MRRNARAHCMRATRRDKQRARTRGSRNARLAAHARALRGDIDVRAGSAENGNALGALVRGAAAAQAAAEASLRVLVVGGSGRCSRIRLATCTFCDSADLRRKVDAALLELREFSAPTQGCVEHVGIHAPRAAFSAESGFYPCATLCAAALHPDFADGTRHISWMDELRGAIRAVHAISTPDHMHFAASIAIAKVCAILSMVCAILSMDLSPAALDVLRGVTCDDRVLKELLLLSPSFADSSFSDSPILELMLALAERQGVKDAVLDALFSLNVLKTAVCGGHAALLSRLFCERPQWTRKTRRVHKVWDWVFPRGPCGQTTLVVPWAKAQVFQSVAACTRALALADLNGRFALWHAVYADQYDLVKALLALPSSLVDVNRAPPEEPLPSQMARLACREDIYALFTALPRTRYDPEQETGVFAIIIGEQARQRDREQEWEQVQEQARQRERARMRASLAGLVFVGLGCVIGHWKRL